MVRCFLVKNLLILEQGLLTWDAVTPMGCAEISFKGCWKILHVRRHNVRALRGGNTSIKGSLFDKNIVFFIRQVLQPYFDNVGTF